MERTFVGLNTSQVIHVTGPAQVDMVDAGGRNLPFLIPDEPNPQLRLVVEKGQEWSGRIFNTVSAAAGAPVDGWIRVYPPGLKIERWEGQSGQEQVLALLCDAAGDFGFTDADLIVPPDAQGMRLNFLITGGNICSHNMTFGASSREVKIPPIYSGLFQLPLLDRTFTYVGHTILPDGSDHMPALSTVQIVVSFQKENPVRTFMALGNLFFADEDNIAQATTYFFVVALEFLNLYKRLTWYFMYDYEDDANTAGGSVNFYAEDPATAGGIAYVTWAFPLGTDVGADRRGVQCINVQDPSMYCIIGVTNSDPAKDLDNFALTGWGTDEY